MLFSCYWNPAGLTVGGCQGRQTIYSGGGFTLAELAFTRITGMTLREAFRKEVAEPLGLTRTGYFQPLDEDLIGNAAFGGRLAEKEDPARGFHYYPEHAAAGLWTTPGELVRIGQALSRSWREGGLLRKETARRMLTPVMDSFGLGIQCFRGDIGYHDGWNEGFLTTWLFSLREDLCVAVMFNRSTNELDWKQSYIAIDLFQTLEEELAEDTDRTDREAFCGRYEHPDDADLWAEEVFTKDGKLYAKFHGDEGTFTSRLYPIGERTFGRRGGFTKIIFGKDCLTVGGITCKKI